MKTWLSTACVIALVTAVYSHSEDLSSIFEEQKETQKKTVVIKKEPDYDTEKRIEKIEEALETVEKRLGRTYQPASSFNTVEKRLEDMEKRMDDIERELRKLEQQLERVERKMR